MAREEYAIIIDYLPNGYPLEKRMIPIAQAVGEKNFILLELIPRKGVELQIGEKVYIGPEKREKIYYIKGRLSKEKITEEGKSQLKEFIHTKVKEQGSKFINFFNTATAINKKVHQIELLPGMGKKHLQEIIKQRKEKPFESFEEMKKRITNLPDPEKAVEKRIFQELTENERYNLFVG